MPRLNRTRFAILGMLSAGPRSGYDLKKDFEHRMRHFWAESVGQIYPTLKQLASEGLVHAAQADGSGRRRRTLYTLTESGRQELRDWLRATPEREVVRNEILLKLFLGPELGIEKALEHIRYFERTQRAFLEHLDGFEKQIEAVADSEEQKLFWLITLSSGQHVARARIAWCRESSRRLRAWMEGQSDADAETREREHR